MKKPQLSIRTTLLLIVGVLNILIAVLVGKGVYQSWAHFQQVQSLKQVTEIVNALYEVNKNLSLERASSLSVIYVLPGEVEAIKKDFDKNRKDTDTAMAFIFAGLQHENNKDVSVVLASIETRYKNLQLLRMEIDSAFGVPIEQRNITIPTRFFDSSTLLITDIQNLILLYTRSYNSIDSTIHRQVMFKYFVWELSEYLGKEYAIIGQMIAENKHPTLDQREQLVSLNGHIQYGWEILHKYAVNDDQVEKFLPAMEEAKTQYFFTFDQIKELFYEDHSSAEQVSYPISIEMWLGLSAQAVDSLLVLQEDILKETKHHFDEVESGAKREIFISVCIFVCALILSFYCWRVIVLRVAHPINSMVNALYKATEENVFEMPKIFYGHDEIGKLMRVLEVFQRNAKKMKQSNDELERFAYIAAHDLKSPLRAVDNISQWLEEDLEEILSEKNKKDMEELRKRVRLMDKLLDDTLEYARINTKLEFAVNESVGGKDLMDEIVSLLDIPADFTVNVSDRVERISVIKFPLQQVLYNLVNNAIKHHDKNNGVVSVDVEDLEKEYIFYVRDDGPGIEPQYHQKIFEMFQTLQVGDKRKGRGMGLAMVKKIVVTNGGDITLESSLGKGAVFRFTWQKFIPDNMGEKNVDVRRRYA